MFLIQGTEEDYTEGGYLDTDFTTNMMAEWWYLNGNTTLVADDGEERDLGFFVVLAHQESPIMVTSDGTQLSYMLTFYGLYYDNGTALFNKTDTYIPRALLSNYVGIHTPYVDYTFPDGMKSYNGSQSQGYELNYTCEDMEMDLLFQTNADKTVDQAEEPLRFITYEHACGDLSGSIVLDGKKYTVVQGESYMDHMISMTNTEITWPMEMHGWSWSEVSTDNYQTVFYGVRDIVGDGYDEYSYKHLILMEKCSGKVISEYFGDEVDVIEKDWIAEEQYNRIRPLSTTLSTSDLKVNINADNVAVFNYITPIENGGFVDFMSFQQEGASISYNDTTEEGNAFWEYLVSDMGALAQPEAVPTATPLITASALGIFTILFLRKQ
ncbi:hypothetical protein [Methanolobus sp. WCC4]|uniref:hypothetical protein n=1 Tax=Methanolobus sp. WCC4 TaxID=3125784 RepID=UPI0030F4E5D0